VNKKFKNQIRKKEKKRIEIKGRETKFTNIFNINKLKSSIKTNKNKSN